MGRRTDTVFAGNYWSDNDEPDLDGDGRSDRPYRLTSVFDHFRGNLTAADLFVRRASPRRRSAPPSATFPVLRLVPVEDDAAARAAARACPRVPAARRRATARRAGLAASLRSPSALRAALVAAARGLGRAGGRR